MRIYLFIFLVFVCNSLAATITTKDGTTYQNAEVSRVESTGIRITHEAGAAFIKFDDMTPSMQSKYGWTLKKSIAEFTTEQDARKEALRRYPELAVTDSNISREFTAQYKALKEKNPDYLRNVQWSLTLARDSYAAVSCTIKEQEVIGIVSLSLRFEEPFPPPNDVDFILRQALERAIAAHPDKDILAMAFDAGGKALKDKKTPGAFQYSGALTYRAAKKAIETGADAAEKRGEKITVTNGNGYAVEVKENQDESTKGVRRWIYIYLVFADEPTIEAADAAMAGEVGKLSAKGVEISAFVIVGDKADRSTWKQLPDPQGGLIGAHYTPPNRHIERRNRGAMPLP